ncbi:MAG: isocitrate/isopropylmalate family dehydrogenase [Enterocloster aldenensis]
MAKKGGTDLMILEAAVINGDGVGPEMMEPALDVLKAVCHKTGCGLKLYPVEAGGAALESKGCPLPEDSLKICREVPAVLFGNTGLKKYQSLSLDKRPEAALMRLRRGLGVTTNIRPVRYYPSLGSFSPLKDRVLSKGLDFVFVRDIVGGVLCSEKVCTQGDFGQEAYEYEYYNEKIVMDTASIAFRLAALRNKSVTNLDKSNVLESSRLWRQTIERAAGDYPDITLDHLILIMAMRIRIAPLFDVIVTSNLFGASYR